MINYLDLLSRVVSFDKGSDNAYFIGVANCIIRIIDQFIYEHYSYSRFSYNDFSKLKNWEQLFLDAYRDKTSYYKSEKHEVNNLYDQLTTNRFKTDRQNLALSINLNTMTLNYLSFLRLIVDYNCKYDIRLVADSNDLIYNIINTTNIDNTESPLALQFYNFDCDYSIEIYNLTLLNTNILNLLTIEGFNEKKEVIANHLKFYKFKVDNSISNREQYENMILYKNYVNNIEKLQHDLV